MTTLEQMAQSSGNSDITDPTDSSRKCTAWKRFKYQTQTLGRADRRKMREFVTGRKIS